MSAIHVGFLGASGRMGRALFEAALPDPAFSVTAALVASDSEVHDKPVDRYFLLETPLHFTSDLSAAIATSDVLIDFSTPSASLAALPYVVAAKKPLVMGTTGFDAAGKKAIAEAAKSIPIVFAPNMGVGVNVCLFLLKTAAKTLGEDYEVEILEAHHRYKTDAPSGTALKMGEVVAETLGWDTAQSFVLNRTAHPGPRGAKEIGFSSIRAADIVGEHTALFAKNGERVEITHRAMTRAHFAEGALRAAKWLKDKKPGLYSMQDVLGLV